LLADHVGGVGPGTAIVGVEHCFTVPLVNQQTATCWSRG
jgi:hypothetical protein